MKKVYVGLTEEMILNYAALPKQLKGWRFYRIEYGGHAEACFMERGIYLPPWADPYDIEQIMERGQQEPKKIEA